jgi:hypothetical protein
VYGGDLGGIAGADAKCQERADAAQFSGTYYAWLSDGGSSPATRFSSSPGPYLLVDGTTVAESYTGLTSGTLEHAIDMTELGGVPSDEPTFGRPIAWSGTGNSGQLQWEEHTCKAWTSAHAHDVATVANPLATTNWSFTWGGSPCHWQGHLLCFEQ